MPSKKNAALAAKNFLKSELAKRGITTETLAKRLAENGVFETKASIDNKISRGTFSAAFLLQCMEAIGCSNIETATVNDMFRHENVPADDQVFIDKDGIRYISILEDNSDAEPEWAVISLFSGAGGLDIGLEQAKFDKTLCVEYDSDCRSTLKYNRPDWIVFEEGEKTVRGRVVKRVPWDVRAIDPKELLDAGEWKKWQVTLLVWGAPCQPFSNIWKKRWKDDPKNGDLFQEFVRMVKGVSPQAFIFENVTGITQSKHSDVIQYMVDQFQWLGYGISHAILNAANYWVPQKRERFFLIGIKGVDKPAFPLPTHTKDKKTWESFTRNLNPAPAMVPRPWVSVDEAFWRISKHFKRRPDYAIMNLSDKVVGRMKYVKQWTNFKVIPLELRPDCWKNGKHQWSDTFWRLIANQPSVTIRTGAYNPSKGRYIHPHEDRGLNTVELSALQTFPEDWIFQSSKGKPTLTSIGKQIGNAVPCGLAKALGLAIKKQIP